MTSVLPRGRSSAWWWTAISLGIAAGAVAATIAVGLSPAATAPEIRMDKPISGPPTGLAAQPSFREEFDGAALDPQRWQTTFAGPGENAPTIARRNLWGNGEKQVYFDPAYLDLGINPFRLTNGILTIEARPLNPGTRDLLEAEISRLPGNLHSTSLAQVAYSSGMISTRGRFAQHYGYFEMRARWSSGKGLWPAFWLLPADGSWPPEIDVLETHGDKPRVTFHSLHLSDSRSTTERVRVANSDGAFHNYGALWLPDRIDYYVDSTKVASIPVPDELDQPMFLVANLAVGGSWPGDPDAATHFPATLEIDYIRAWSLAPSE